MILILSVKNLISFLYDIDFFGFRVYNRTMKYKYITQQGNIFSLKGIGLISSINVSSIASIYMDHLAPNDRFKGDTHNLYEFFYLVSGNMDVLTDRGNFFLSPNEFIILPPDVHHAMNPHKCYTLSISITFDAKGLNDELIALKKGKLDDQEIAHLNAVTESYEKHFAYKPGVLLPVETCLKDEYAYQQIIKNETEILLILITRDHLNQREYTETSISPLEETLADKIKEYIDRHFNEKIQLEEIGGLLGYCKEHICRVFKKKYNMSVIGYMLQKRIERAQQMLANENVSLQRISDELGFDSMQYFIKIFKRYTSTTPRQYRLIVQRTHIMNLNQFTN